MIHNRMCKRLMIFGFFVMVGLLFTACKKKPDENGSMISEDGRSYGGVIDGEIGKELETTFFRFKMEEATSYSSFQFDDGLYKAPEGETYLVLKLTIENTYEKDLPMSISDFVLDFDGNEKNNKIFGYGNTDLNNTEFMDNVFTLKKGESITKNILFTVKDKKQYTIRYHEYYEDQFDGNTYQIEFKPTKQ